MLHTMYLTCKTTKNVYYELLKTLPNLKQLSEYSEWNTSFYKTEGLSIIRLKEKCIGNSFHYFGIEVQLNPSRLVEKDNHIQITSFSNIDDISEKFDLLINKFNKSLPGFLNWTVRRIDYAVDIKTPYVKEYIQLFQKGDKPVSFDEGVYSPISHRNRQRRGSMYYSSKSVTINFYDKHDQKVDESIRNPSVSQIDISNAENILRYEVQCKKGKTNYIKFKNNFDCKELAYFLDLDVARDILIQNYDSTVGRGQFYKLADAEKLIIKSKNTEFMKNNLINTLKLVAQARSVWRAREQFIKGIQIKNTDIILKGSKQTFNDRINKLREMDINPITVPRDWFIERVKLCGEKENYLDNHRGEIWNEFTFVMDWDAVL